MSMELNIYLLLALLIALLVIAYLLAKLHRVRGQLSLIKDALTDIKKGFKSRAIFYIRHITSPYYILLFIGCAGNDVICVFDSFYNSFIEYN